MSAIITQIRCSLCGVNYYQVSASPPGSGFLINEEKYNLRDYINRLKEENERLASVTKEEIMTHTEIHKLERIIAKVLAKGFCGRQDHKFDEADAIQAAYDISDVIMGDYFIEPKPTLSNAKQASINCFDSTNQTKKHL